MAKPISSTPALSVKQFYNLLLSEDEDLKGQTFRG